jgi:predicted transglutaminase-like cysteine proteinase
MKGIYCILMLACIGVPDRAAAQSTAMLPAPSSAMITLGEARPVPAWVKFCEQDPADCAVNLAEPETIRLTRASWQAIVNVNAKVNAAITPMVDDDHWGAPDVWTYPTDGYGDCEDYQLLKRRLLVEAGFPQRALRITVVIDEKGDGHAVLMVRTDRGDFILDNKAKVVLPWHQTGYVFVKREGADGAGWTSLGGVTSPTMTANR